MTKKKKTLKVNEGYPEGKSDANSNSGALTAEEISEKYTVAELRDILRENGLKVSGRKQELVERVLPILNDESSETSGEDVSDEVELTEKEKVIEAEKILLTQTEDSGSADDTELSIPVNEEFLTSSLDNFGINYGNLAIKEKISTDDNAELTIQGFTKNGLSMSDYNMSVVAASDSSNINFKLNIPEVSYTDFETTIFTFKNLDLFILPSSNPQSLEISALLDTLEIITETNYVNLKDLNLFFKSFPDENGARLDINIKNFLYPDFNGTSFNFKNLDFNLAIGLNEQNLVISVNLPKLNLLNKNYAVNLSDLNLNIVVPDLELSNLDLSINMSDFHYTNFDDVLIDMDKVDVSIDPILNSSNFNVNIGMNTLDATGLNSFDELFPMLNITAVNFKNSADDSIPPINLTCLMSLFDISKMSLSSLVSLLGSGFDLETYTRNMPGQYKTSLDADDVDISSTEVPYSDNSGFNIGKIFKNCDYSSLNTIVLDLSGLIDSTGIDLSQLGIDVSDYDLSAISLSDLIDTLTKSEFIMSLIALVSKLSSVKLDNLDFSGLVVSFDKDKFDISGLLGSLNLSELDISGILDMFNKSDVDLVSVFENCDYSCLGSIVLNLSGLVDSLGIDLSDLGIDLSDYDLSAISLSDIIDVLSKFEFNMSTISAVFKLFGLELDDVDLSGLISSFDTDNFDISALLGSLNLSGLDISAILDMFNNSDVDLDAIFKDCDYSCLGAIVLDVSGLIDSAGIDLSELGIDVSDYDLSAISLSDIIDILNKSDFDLAENTSELDLSTIELDNLDFSGLVVSFDKDKFDISSLLGSLNLSELDISGILDMFNNSGVDLASVFKNCDYSCLGSIVLDLSGLIDSLGIDLSDLGIDLSDYDLSAISLSDIIDVLSKFEFDLSTISAVFKLFGLELDDVDLSGLISSFDTDNFDISALLGSLNLSGLDISGISDMFNNSDVDLEKIFEKCDYSCLGAIVLDVSGLIDSLGIDLSDLGIDVSDYDLSAISLSDLIDLLIKSEFVMSLSTLMSKLFTIKLDNIDTSGLIVSFDSDNFDISGLLTSLDLSAFDISGILDMYNMNGFDLTEFLNNLISLFMVKTLPEVTNTNDTK